MAPSVSLWKAPSVSQAASPPMWRAADWLMRGRVSFDASDWSLGRCDPWKARQKRLLRGVSARRLVIGRWFVYIAISCSGAVILNNIAV